MDKSFAASLNIRTPSFGYFCQVAATQLYQFAPVLLCQEIDLAEEGIRFYERKLKILISENHADARSFYSYITSGITNCWGMAKCFPQIEAEYAERLQNCAAEFIDKYSRVLVV